MPRRALCFFAFFVASVLLAPSSAAITVDQLRDPRPNSWVLDQAGALSPETEAELQRLSARVKAETGAELVVVVIDSTQGLDAHQFALDLANRWGLGDAQKDDGLLVFAALEDRAAEILLGDGIDSDTNVLASESVMQHVMLPRFRAQDPAGAVLLAGAEACARQSLLGGQLLGPRRQRPMVRPGTCMV